MVCPVYFCLDLANLQHAVKELAGHLQDFGSGLIGLLKSNQVGGCLLYTSDAADEMD
jgi:hypothetical protein